MWIVLGCQYDPSTERCLIGQGFRGIISEVTLYGYEVSFENLTNFSRKINHAVCNPVMMWGEFRFYAGVTRVYPSYADETCPTGLMNPPKCVDSVPGWCCSLIYGQMQSFASALMSIVVLTVPFLI